VHGTHSSSRRAAAAGAPANNRFGTQFASLAGASELAVLADIEATDVARTPTGIDELDRVLGGGIVSGGVTLIGGDPGIGKSTLLLQAVDGAAARGAERALRHRRGKRRAGGAALAPAGPGSSRRCRCWPRSSWRRSSPRSTPRARPWR
jgi:hypothetical protein